MKFLCPSCKAKYQIADEKVIGRTVKMKCRQCGYVIEINEASMVSGGASEAPKAIEEVSVVPPSARPNRPQSPAQSVVSSPVGAKAPPPKPAPRAPTPPTGIAAVRKPTEAVKPDVARPVTPAPRPVSSPLAAPRPVGGIIEPRASRTTASADSAVPRPGIERKSQPHSPPPSERSKASTGAPPSERGKPIVESPQRPAAAAAPRPSVTKETPGKTTAGNVGRIPGVSETLAHSLGAVAATAKPDPLAGAFAKAVEDSPAQVADHQLAGDEWYVGVGEQPIGPIRLAEIRDRASRGEISLECLVWRDGFEDWRPLTAFPELVAVVEDGIASARSMMPPATHSLSPNTIPRLQPVQAFGGSPNAATLAVTEPVMVATASAPLQSQPTQRVFDEEPLEVAGISKQKIPVAAWFAVLMALVLGVTMGVVFIKPEPPKQIIKYVEVPAKSVQNVEHQPVAAGVAQPSEGNVVAAENVEGRAQASGGARKVAANNGTSADTAAAASAPQLQGLKGLSGLRGLGPQGGPQANGASVPGGASQLDSATLSKTVSRYTPSVKRSCWQPALDMRPPDAPTTARVTATITVGPNGRVQNVSTSGDPKGYRGLSSCIQSRVKNWEFPPAGGTTEFNVPFVFAAQ